MPSPVYVFEILIFLNLIFKDDIKLSLISKPLDCITMCGFKPKILLVKSVYADKIQKVIVTGNERISSETIILFGEVNLDKDFSFSSWLKNEKMLITTEILETELESIFWLASI